MILYYDINQCWALDKCCVDGVLQLCKTVARYSENWSAITIARCN